MATPSDWADVIQQFRALPAQCSRFHLMHSGSYFDASQKYADIAHKIRNGEIIFPDQAAADEMAKRHERVAESYRQAAVDAPSGAWHLSLGLTEGEERKLPSGIKARVLAYTKRAAVLAGLAGEDSSEIDALSAWADRLKSGVFARFGGSVIDNLPEASALLGEEMLTRAQAEYAREEQARRVVERLRLDSERLELDRARSERRGVETTQPSTRASWLQFQMDSVPVTLNWLAQHGGPDNKSIGKVLRGEPVEQMVLQKLAKALGAALGVQMTTSDIPPIGSPPAENSDQSR